MRIIGGDFRGHKVFAPSGLLVRPTPDRVREALFNLLGQNLDGVVFMDLFAGAGTVGIEAVSRGAPKAVFVESDSQAVAFLKANIQKLGCQDRCRVIPRRVESLSGSEFADASVVFLDPPYQQHPNLTTLGEFLEKAERPPVVIYQHAIDDLPGSADPKDKSFSWRPGWMPDKMDIIEERRYGRTVLTVFAEDIEEEEKTCQ